MGDTQLGELNEKEILDVSLFLKCLLRMHEMIAGYLHKRLDSTHSEVNEQPCGPPPPQTRNAHYIPRLQPQEYKARFDKDE